MEKQYKGKAVNEKDVLAYIIKTSDGIRVAIFSQESKARQFLLELARLGCELPGLHIEKFTN